MAHVLKIVDASNDATVYFDFYAPAGTGNPNNLITKTRSLDLGSDRPEPEFFTPESLGDPSLLRYELPPVPMQVIMYCGATTWANLDAAIVALRGYLLDFTNKRLLIQQETAPEKRYADIIIGDVPSILRGQGPDEEIVALQDKKIAEITVTMIRKWGLRRPMVTVGPTTVQNDPADAQGRSIEVTNPGNAPTPAAVKIAGNTGSRLERILIARKSAVGYPSSRITDYTQGTQYAQLDTSGNGWTRTLSGDTAVVADATDGSGNNVAETNYASNPTLMAKRVRIIRTTNLDSLRGDVDVYVRVKATAAAKHILQFRSSISLADPATFTGDEIPHDTLNVLSFDYIDVYLGRVSIPQEHTLGGLAFEFWSRREGGSGNLRWDFASFVPVEPQGMSSIFVPWMGRETILGRDLVEPTDPTAATPGSIDGDSMSLGDNGDTAAEPPAGGRVLPAGRHRWTFRMTGQGDGEAEVRVRRVGAPGTNHVFLITGGLSGFDFTTEPYVWTLEADISDSASYQAQVEKVGGGTLQVNSFDHEFKPYIASGEEAHADPERMLLVKMDAADNIVSPMAVDGPLPLWLMPGPNAVYFHFSDIPIVSGAPGEASKRDRDCPVTITFEPRDLS